MDWDLYVLVLVFGDMMLDYVMLEVCSFVLVV